VKGENQRADNQEKYGDFPAVLPQICVHVIHAAIIAQNRMFPICR
jgi:hypothetical protein